LQRDRLQTVFSHGAQLDQLLPIAQQAQYFATLRCWSMQTRKLFVDHNPK
jgi:hypothetical protein